MDKKMAFYLPVCLALMTILVSIAGCAPKQPNQPQGVILGDDASGKQVTLKADQALTVRLESNVTTGFSWEIAEVDDAVLKLQGEPQYEEQNSGKQREGAGGWQVFHFAPVKSGQTNLTLVYRRPWEKDKQPIKTYTVQITIQ